MIRSGSEPTAWGTTRVIGRVSLAASAQARSTAGTDYRSLRPTTALSLQAEQTSDKQPSAARQGKPFARYRAAAVSHWGGEMESASVCPLGICVSTGSTDPPTHCAPSGRASACSPFVTLISLYARQADERTSSGIRDADRSTAMHVAREAGMAQATREAKKKAAPRLEAVEHAGTRRRRARPGARLEENGERAARSKQHAGRNCTPQMCGLRSSGSGRRQ